MYVSMICFTFQWKLIIILVRIRRTYYFTHPFKNQEPLSKPKEKKCNLFFADWSLCVTLWTLVLFNFFFLCRQILLRCSKSFTVHLSVFLAFSTVFQMMGLRAESPTLGYLSMTRKKRISALLQNYNL